MIEKQTCPFCKKVNIELYDKCVNCDYPFKCTNEEKSHFIASQIIIKNRKAKMNESIRQSQIILIVIACSNFFIPLFQFFNVKISLSVLTINLIIGSIFLFFGFYVKKKPFISILISLIILLILYGLSMLINSVSIFDGIILKIIFIATMIYSLINIKKLSPDSTAPDGASISRNR